MNKNMKVGFSVIVLLALPFQSKTFDPSTILQKILLEPYLVIKLMTANKKKIMKVIKEFIRIGSNLKTTLFLKAIQ